MIVLVLAVAEDLTDRQAADMVRRAIDWKYALGRTHTAELTGEVGAGKNASVSTAAVRALRPDPPVGAENRVTASDQRLRGPPASR